MLSQNSIFSIIIPVYNRPDELRELLESLVRQADKGFEVIIVEDGSEVKSGAIVQSFEDKLRISYFEKPNEGPGPTRNYGALRARGDYLVFFDSDCLIPETYIATVRAFLMSHPLDLYGGPDAAHPSFTPIQKAISYSMTSFLTTGGIRGGKKKIGTFHPRSFNMGFSRQVFEKTAGFSAMRFGEDLDFSMRAVEAGFTSGLIDEAFVYHKRRTDFRKFFKQVHNSGIARINLYKRHPQTLKAVHFFPAAFTIFFILSIGALLSGYPELFSLLVIYFLLIMLDAGFKFKDPKVALLSAVAALVQHIAYGTGFIKAFWKRIILKQDEFHSYGKNFYK